MRLWHPAASQLVTAAPSSSGGEGGGMKPAGSQPKTQPSFCLFCLEGFKVLRDVIHTNYIRRPKKRGKQVGKEGVITPKSYCQLGVLAWELIKSGTRVLQVS